MAQTTRYCRPSTDEKGGVYRLAHVNELIRRVRHRGTQDWFSSDSHKGNARRELGALHPLKPNPPICPRPRPSPTTMRRASATGRTPRKKRRGFQRGAATRTEIDDFIRNEDAQEAATARAPDKAGRWRRGAPLKDTGTPPETPKGHTGGEPAAPTEQAEIDGLKRYGLSDDEITAMDPGA
jgi:hypothetical protein